MNVAPPDSLRHRLLAVPILFKILGIGLLVAGIFGIATLTQARSAMARTLQDLLTADSINFANTLSRSLEEPTATGDIAAIDRQLRRAQREDDSLRYATVWDHDMRLVATSLPDLPPEQILPVTADGLTTSYPLLRDFSTDTGHLLDLVLPISDSTIGWLQIGMDGTRATGELHSLTLSLSVLLLFCMVLGMGLALLLADAITRPVQHLVQSARALAAGDLRSRARVMSQDETGTLSTVFNHMAESLEAQRQELVTRAQERQALIDRLVDATEQERKTLAQELHDHLGQMLLAVLLEVQRLPIDRPITADRREALAVRIARLADEVRLLAWGMRPSLLDDHGLYVALERYAAEVARYAEIQIAVEAVGLDPHDGLPDRIAITCYRIAQEALSNIVRHSQARNACIILVLRNGVLGMLVEDDGIGFDVDSVPSASTGHLGLTGMRERATLVGGRCQYESTTNGTSVRVEIPLELENDL